MAPTNKVVVYASTEEDLIDTVNGFIATHGDTNISYIHVEPKLDHNKEFKQYRIACVYRL